VPINSLGNTYSEDITEDLLYDITRSQENTQFTPSDIAYDLSINNIPFVIKSDNQYKYVRETAQYKKDQFDNSPEPGEQSLLGWWLRSQTSWHNGAGIEFYEPGTDYQHVSHRFKDSRGVDVWTVGEMRLHKKVYHAYTGIKGINAATGQWTDTSGATPVNREVLVSGDDNGILKRITPDALNGAVATANYTAGATYPDGHGGTDFPFYSVTTDGSTYYAACSRCIHKGTIGTLTSDDVFFKHSTTSNANILVKYAKGNVFVGTGRTFGLLPTTTTTHTHTTGAADTFTNSMNHINTSWNWVDATGSPGPLFFAGNGGNNGEIWSATIDPNESPVTNTINLAGATMVLSLPDGETINAIHYYLGYLAVGTSRGVRICPIGNSGNPVMGPLLVETAYPVNAFTERGTYLYAATKVLEGADTNAILIRIDLTQQFDDGTFAYAYDLEYESSVDGDSSDCTEVYNINDRIVMVIQEDSDTVKGELQIEHTTDYRSSGYVTTGNIRFNTTEPKFFKFITINGSIAEGDGITVTTIDANGNEFDLLTLDTVSIGSEVDIAQPAIAVEQIGLKFTLINGSPITNYPVLKSYQLKALPAARRQRLIQYNLQCFDSEFDHFNTQFGYTGRGFELLTTLEQLEEQADFVRVTDYRTNETFKGLIEEVKFANESSPDKNDNGFGGIVTLLIRKI
jgi:hypothetical protein